MSIKSDKYNQNMGATLTCSIFNYFSLKKAIARYHTNAVSTVEILQELINLAKEIREARRRGAENGLSEDEIAFHDVLAKNQSAVAVMGDASLRVIAHELWASLKGNITVNRAHRESARARMRVLVKRILLWTGFRLPGVCHPGHVGGDGGRAWTQSAMNRVGFDRPVNAGETQAAWTARQMRLPKRLAFK
jgi:hypothetical protein